MATPAPVFLPGKSHGQRSLADYSPWGRKESTMTEQLNDNDRKVILSDGTVGSIRLVEPMIGCFAKAFTYKSVTH